ncbi:TIGR01244 family sulfur transferase [Sphingomonas sp.]|uniref:TIGR01244 family sulfur transferase n=1 Tax=Sphingomonas sp. TaxID=28214 RepID=UPI00325FB54E
MTIEPLSPDLSVMPQIATADVADLAARGFKSIIGNRPEGEAPGQPAWSSLAAEAARHGMWARQIPVVPGQIDSGHVDQFATALREMPAPIAAFCRTGTRSAMLWALANPDALGVDERIATAAAHGFDLAPLRPRMEP